MTGLIGLVVLDTGCGCVSQGNGSKEHPGAAAGAAAGTDAGIAVGADAGTDAGIAAGTAAGAAAGTAAGIAADRWSWMPGSGSCAKPARASAHLLCIFYIIHSPQTAENQEQ